MNQQFGNLLWRQALTQLYSSSHARLEQKLHDFMEDIREGKREGSIISTKNGPELDVDDQEAWTQLRRELEDVGLSPAVLHENIGFIKNWFKEALAQSWLEEVRSSVDEKNEAFLRAAKAGDTALVKSLLASAVYLDYIEPESGRNALHMAAGAGHKQTVKALIDGGMRPETKDSSGNTVLCLAVIRGRAAVVEVLLKYHINVDEQDSDSCTALHLAAHWARTAIVENLIRNGANLNIQTKSRGYTPLHAAVYSGHWDVGRVLIEAGADVNA